MKRKYVWLKSGDFYRIREFGAVWASPVGGASNESKEDSVDEWKDSDDNGEGDNSDFFPNFNNNVFFSIVIALIIIFSSLSYIVYQKRLGRKK